MFYYALLYFIMFHYNLIQQIKIEIRIELRLKLGPKLGLKSH